MTSPAALRPGAYYHIYNRGNNREDLFREERNYSYFLKLYADHVDPIAETFAYCLLKNHFHILVRVREGLPERAAGQGFANLFNAYGKAINKAYGRTGSLFEHPYGRIEITDNVYFWRLVTYIHRNPERHGLVDDFRNWPHVSYHTVIANGPTKLQRQAGIGWFDTRDGFLAARKVEKPEPELAKLAPDDAD